MYTTLHRRAFLQSVALTTPGTAVLSSRSLARRTSSARTLQRRFGDVARFRASTRCDDGTLLLAGETVHLNPVVVAMDGTGTVQWRWSTDTEGRTEAHDVLETDDGGLLVAGRTIPERWDSEAFATKLDRDRNEEWTVTHNEGHGVTADATIAAARFEPGQYVLVWHEGTTELSWAHVQAVDDSGTKRWLRTYHHEGWTDVAAVLELPESAVLVVGDLFATDDETTNVASLTVDDSENERGSLGFPTHAASSIQGGELVAASAEFFGRDGRSNAYQPELARVDTDAALEWQTTIDERWTGYIARQVRHVPDGGAVLLATVDGAVDDRPGTLLVKVAPDGTHEWTAGYAAPDEVVSAMTVIPLPDDRFLLGGTVEPTERSKDSDDRGWAALVEGGPGGRVVSVPSVTPTPTPPQTRTPTASRVSPSATPSPTSTPTTGSSQSSPDTTTVTTPGFGLTVGLGGILVALINRWLPRTE